MRSDYTWTPYQLDQLVELRRGLTWSAKQECNEPIDGSVPVLRICNIQDRLEMKELLYLDNVSKEDQAKCAVNKGWSLIVSSNGNPNRVGNCIYIDGNMKFVFASFLVALGTKDTNRLRPQYLYRLLRSDNVQKAISRNVQGSTGLNNINLNLLMKDRIDLPTIQEQDFIITVLNALDDVIDQTRAVIDQTQRVKSALLQDLFTYGLPGQHKKFEDVRNVGRIPAEWKITRLVNLLETVTSGSRGWAQYYCDNGPMFLGIGNLTREDIYMRFEEVRRVNPPDDSEGQRTRVQAGDILISVTADLGIIGCIPKGLGEAYVSQHIALVRLKKEHVNPAWIAYCLASKIGQDQFRSLNDPGAKAGLNLQNVKRLNVVVPGKKEQDKIVSILDSVQKRIVESTIAERQLINVRAALSQGLLTGKIRVKV